MAFNGRLEINYFSSNFIPPAIDDKANVGTLKERFVFVPSELNKRLKGTLHGFILSDFRKNSQFFLYVGWAGGDLYGVYFWRWTL